MSTSKLLWLLAVAAGVSVASLYYCQPLLAVLAADFSTTERGAGLVATLTQAGYAAGMLLVVPLGDTAERRRLIVLAALCSAAAPLAVAAATSLAFLCAASFALGLTTVVPQLAVPFAARGRARPIGGQGDFRPAGGDLIVTHGERPDRRAPRLARDVPHRHCGDAAPRTGPSHFPSTSGARAATLLPGAPPLAAGPVARAAPAPPRDPGCAGARGFQCLLDHADFLARGAAGAFGIVGVAGALAAPLAGTLADRIGTRAVNGLALLLVLISYCVFAASGRSLVLLGVGVVLLDLGVQANHISNQTRILGLSADARNRLNSVYIALYFTGAAACSALASHAYASWRWAGVSALGIGLALLALVAFFTLDTGAAKAADEAAATRRREAETFPHSRPAGGTLHQGGGTWVSW